MLRELADIITGPLSIIFQWSWESGEVPIDGKLANVMDMIFWIGNADSSMS